MMYICKAVLSVIYVNKNRQGNIRKKFDSVNGNGNRNKKK